MHPIIWNDMLVLLAGNGPPASRRASQHRGHLPDWNGVAQPGDQATEDERDQVDSDQSVEDCVDQFGRHNTRFDESRRSFLACSAVRSLACLLARSLATGL